MRRRLFAMVLAFCLPCLAQNPVILDLDLENETNYFTIGVPATPDMYRIDFRVRTERREMRDYNSDPHGSRAVL